MQTWLKVLIAFGILFVLIAIGGILLAMKTAHDFMDPRKAEQVAHSFVHTAKVLPVKYHYVNCVDLPGMKGYGIESDDRSVLLVVTRVRTSFFGDTSKVDDFAVVRKSMTDNPGIFRAAKNGAITIGKREMKYELGFEADTPKSTEPNVLIGIFPPKDGDRVFVQVHTKANMNALPVVQQLFSDVEEI